MEINRAPTGMQYGARKETEESLDAVPLPDGAGTPPMAPQGRDPLSAAAEFQPARNVLHSDDQSLAGLPMAAPPQQQRGLPQANLDAIAMLPLLPGLVARAQLPGVSPTFRAWVRRLMSELPPEVTTRQIMEASSTGHPMAQ